MGQKRAAKNENGDRRRPGYTVPQAALHDFKLRLKHLFFCSGFAIRFSEVDKESGHIEEAGKPSDDSDNVQ